MSAFSGQFDWDTGLIWQVGFGDGKTRLTAATFGDALHVCPALVDTGASGTCVAKSVVNALGLQPVSKTNMQTAGGSVDANTYDVHVALLLGGEQNPDGSVTTRTQVFYNARVVEFDSGDESYQALIGRDILCHGVFTTSFDGHFSFAY